jgi:hypothetical protein
MYIEQIICVKTKQCEKLDAKKANSCEKREANTSKRTSETHAKWISVRFFLL